jgi:hypothetical protein
MAKVRVKNLRQVKSSIRKKFVKALRSQKIRDEIGQLYKEAVQLTEFPVTSEATKAWRRYLEQANKTAAEYSRNKINATFTGELMDDLASNVKAKLGQKQAEYVIANSKKLHKKYKKPNGKPVKGKRQSYEEIAGHLKKLGYDYLDAEYLTNNQELFDELKRVIRELIIKEFDN